MEILQTFHEMFHHVVCRIAARFDPLLECIITQLSGEVVSSIDRLFQLKQTQNN